MLFVARRFVERRLNARAQLGSAGARRCSMPKPLPEQLLPRSRARQEDRQTQLVVVRRAGSARCCTSCATSTRRGPSFGSGIATMA